MKSKLTAAIGTLLLLIGVSQYIFPLFLDQLGSYSGLVGFLFVFAGISLLKVRKDQINK